MQGVFVEKVLSTMLQEIKSALKLTQPMLAEALGVKVDRVKSLTSGKVAKLTQAETRSLVEKLHVNPGWLATGEGEMLQSPKNYPSDQIREGVERFFGDDTPSNQIKVNPAETVAPDGFILVPHYEVQASAGHGSLIHSEQIVDYLAFKADWVRNTLGVAQKDLL